MQYFSVKCQFIILVCNRCIKSASLTHAFYEGLARETIYPETYYGARVTYVLRRVYESSLIKNTDNYL